jgi:hypothetical protein
MSLITSRHSPVELLHGAQGAVNTQLVHTEKATYAWVIPAAAVGADKLYADLFNGAASGKVIRILEILVIPKLDVAIVGAVSVRLDAYRTSAVGTGGNAAPYQSATRDVAGGSIFPLDTANATLPAQITARAVPAGGATIAEWLTTEHVICEESATSGSYCRRFDQLNPAARRFGQLLTLREGQGLLLKQGAVASVGSMGFQVVFSVE